MHTSEVMKLTLGILGLHRHSYLIEIAIDEGLNSKCDTLNELKFHVNVSVARKKIHSIVI